jgi:energy-coupling factor transporter ATP-binding protein EcfA2
MASHATDVGPLLGGDEAVASYAAAIAHHRNRLRAAWQSASQPVERVSAQIRAVDVTRTRRQAELDVLVRKSTFKPDMSFIPRKRALPPATIDGWLQRARNGDWAVSPEIEKAFDFDANSARVMFEEYRKRVFGQNVWREAMFSLSRFAMRVSRLIELQAMLDAELKRATAERSGMAARERANAERALDAGRAYVTAAMSRLPAPLQPWDSPAWADWATQPAVSDLDHVYAGTLIPLDGGDLGENASFGSAERIPCFLSLRRNLELVHDAASRDRALSLARSLLLRHLSATEPGSLRFCFFDPVGLGQSVADFLALAEYDADLIGGKVWSSQGDLAARLTELTSHIELVIQKYLRTTYQTIDEFNAAAGEIAEPYRYLILCDFPTGFTDETMQRLRSILQNGPRCGVRTLLLTNTGVVPAYNVDPGRVAGAAYRVSIGGTFVCEDQGYTLRMRMEEKAPPEAAASIIDTVGRRAASRTEEAVTFEKAVALFAQVASRGLNGSLPAAAAGIALGDESTWWRADSTRGLSAPIGQKGARDAAILTFDSGNHAGALLVGRPGSGKSTLLHALVGGLSTLYSPGELELYLIDFKEGVEFKAYAEEGLPHARMVAVESDREFGLSVLQSLEAEMSRRGELLRGTGGRHAGLQALREASGESLPRVLLVFDEFQVLFARNDKLGITAAGLLETIIRQGRGFGVHVLLGSQSLAGLDALGSHVPQLLPTRILLPATEADARRVLGDGNDAGQYLTNHGEGILNAVGGAVEANERFKGALLTETDRIDLLRRLRAKADAAGFTRRPTVFEGNASVPLDATDPAAFQADLARSGSAPVRLRVGVPMAISASPDIDLRREAGANVLAVVREAAAADGQQDGSPSGPAYGLLTACLVSAAQSPARIDVIDFLPADDGLDEVCEPLLDRGRITLRRRRAFAPLVDELRKEVRDRLEADDTRRPARLAFLFGVHRARELDADIGSLDADPELAEALEEVMRDGPEVGVHVWLWSDSVGGAAKRLSPRMMRECTWRIAGKMSPDDSLSLLGNERAAEIRERQLLLSNDDRGILTRVMSFGLPGPGWLAQVLDGPDSVSGLGMSASGGPAAAG